MDTPARVVITTNDPEARPANNVRSVDSVAEDALVERVVAEVLRRLEARGISSGSPSSDKDAQATSDEGDYFKVRKNEPQRPMSEY